MAKKKKEEKQEKTEDAAMQPVWAISPDWLAQNNRSMVALAWGYLCPRCTKKLGARGSRPSPEAILAAIRDCCSRREGFISMQTPVLESIFRLFLANGNRPLPLDALSRELNERRGGDVYRTVPETMLRLLKSDNYYGLKEVRAE